MAKNEYTVTLDTEDAPWSDDEIEVTLTEPGMLDKAVILGRIPDDVLRMDTSSITTIPEGLDIMIEEMITGCSDFEFDLYNDLSDQSASLLLKYCTNVFAGNEPTYSKKSYQKNNSATKQYDLDLDENGSVNLEDYR